ncbi:MAG: hypothetical protein AAF944_26045 [Bacteroidota bacterium]
MNKNRIIGWIDALYTTSEEENDPELRELQEVRALLQSLPDPQTPQDLNLRQFLPQPSQPHRSLRWWSGVAATLALLLAVGYGWWSMAPDQSESASSEAKPAIKDPDLPDAQLMALQQAVAALQAQHRKDSVERTALVTQVQHLEKSLTKSQQQLQAYQVVLKQTQTEMRRQQAALKQSYQQQLSEWTTYLETQHQTQTEELASYLMQWQTIAQDNSLATDWLLTYLLNTTPHDTITQN